MHLYLLGKVLSPSSLWQCQEPAAESLLKSQPFPGSGLSLSHSNTCLCPIPRWTSSFPSVHTEAEVPMAKHRAQDAPPSSLALHLKPDLLRKVTASKCSKQAFLIFLSLFLKKQPKITRIHIINTLLQPTATAPNSTASVSHNLSSTFSVFNYSYPATAYPQRGQ